jgi:23S rRNA pseudouridine2605 synthase
MNSRWLLRTFSSSGGGGIKKVDNSSVPGVRLSALLCKHLGLSRRQSVRMILADRVTLYGEIVNAPAFQLRPNPNPNQNSSSAMKLDGKLLLGVDKTLKSMYLEQQKQHNVNEMDISSNNNNNGDDQKQKKGNRQNPNMQNTRVWLANKLKGELVTEHDPDGRPSMLQRLIRGGVGEVKNKHSNKGSSSISPPPIHLKPVGRLDMMTEGLIIFTNDGQYARELELPKNHLWRTYRVRVHGRLTPMKMRAMRVGVTARVDDGIIGDAPSVTSSTKMMKYKGLKVKIERKSSGSSSQTNRRSRRGKFGAGRKTASGGANTWLRITCTEGKNRQLRRILGALGLDVTRLIRISYGDYDLNTIPPGRALEVPPKALESMKKKGQLFTTNEGKKKEKAMEEESRSTVEWVNYA